ncbi:hypothetical protein V5O48_003852 [Marasmius crinis-equi]|uniref:EthD domain-containing protein n=1 Tax=Marasmius crinis-equi TaxID=585013 RepID=A0ABR3FRQ3_9AGAR
MAPAPTPNHVRVLFYMQKHKSMTFEEFSEHWRVTHPPLFLGTKAVKQNLLKYEQWHVNQRWKQQLSDEGVTVPDYDGIVVIEAETVEKALATFSGLEYTEVVFPDSKKFCDLATIVYRAFEITTVFNNTRDHTSQTAQDGVIRGDIGMLVVDFHRKDSLNPSDFAKYWREVHGAKILAFFEASGLGNDLLKYEQLTVDSTSDSSNLPLAPAPVSWDAVSIFEARTIKQIRDTFKDQRFVAFEKENTPNFVDTTKPFEVLPCDVVTFNIERS